MQLECDGISASIGYLNIEIKRTIIKLKICSYRQRTEKNVSINEITTIRSVDQSNSFVESNKSPEKSTSISGRSYEYRDSREQTNLEQRRIDTSSLQCLPSSKIMRTSAFDSINNTTIETEFTNQESSKFMDEGTTFGGDSKSIR